MSGIKAGVVVVNRFCSSSSKEFSNYISYIDREEAIRQEYLSEYNLYNDYMDNPEKTTGLFTSDNFRLSLKEKELLKERFKKAQDNNSLMWQTVISFDNRWLAEHGLYDAENQIVDERRLKEYATGAINTMLKNESLQNATWSGAIHYNTDNVHIHVAIVETNPQREKVMYQQYEYVPNIHGEYVQLTNGEYVKANGRNEMGKSGLRLPHFDRRESIDENGNPLFKEEYKGRFKLKSIEACKKYMVDNIIEQKENNILINKIIREQIVKSKKNMSLAKDAELKKDFLALYKAMPDVNRSLWNYNNNIMKKLRPQIDELTTRYLEKYHKESLLELREILHKQSEEYNIAYGTSDRDFEENKINELYERMGNAILKEIKYFDKNVTGSNVGYSQSSQKMLKNIDKKGTGRKYKWGKKLAIELDKSCIALKKAMDKTYEEESINMREYHKLEKELFKANYEK